MLLRQFGAMCVERQLFPEDTASPFRDTLMLSVRRHDGDDWVSQAMCRSDR